MLLIMIQCVEKKGSKGKKRMKKKNEPYQTTEKRNKAKHEQMRMSNV